MTHRRTLYTLAALTLVALVLRLAAIHVLQAWNNPSAMEHDSIAKNLVEGIGFSFGEDGYFGPSSVQSPPYPFLLAGLFLIFGTMSKAAFYAAMVLNALASAATVPALYAAVRSVGGRAPTALLAAALLALWPSQIYATTFVQAISLITLCTIAIIPLFLFAARHNHLPAWIAYSLIATIAALTEPVLLPPLFLTGIIILLWRTLPFTRRILFGSVLAAAAALVIGPWTARNYAVHGQFIPGKATFWVNMWKANKDNSSGTDRPPMPAETRTLLLKQAFRLTDSHTRDTTLDAPRQYDSRTPEQLAEVTNKTEPQREAAYARWTKSWLAANPAEYARLCVVRLAKTLWTDWDNPKSYNIINLLTRSLLLLTLVPGLILAITHRWSIAIPALYAIAALALYTFAITAARFALPYEPMQLALTALLLTSIRLPKPKST